jgi:putative endonuclease
VSKEYYVYIMASASRVLYTGITNDLRWRVWEHKRKLVPGFTKKYNCTRLVHYGLFDRVGDAIAREKEIKGWLRKKKIALIESKNGSWRDLSWGWLGSEVLPLRGLRASAHSAQNDTKRRMCVGE